MDFSLLTGEPIPVEVGPGDAVTGGGVNANGRLLVRATRVGADTQLARIGRLVTLAAWLASGHPATTAFTAAVAVLIIAPPCAMGLATPTAILTGTGRGAQLGILISGPEVLESTRTVGTIVLDKTGTLTAGRMSLTEVITAPGQPEAELLRLVGALESGSEHPIAAAVGISEVIAGVLPAGKVDAIKQLQAAGHVVALAGDGVNDAAALAQVDLGLAMGTGADVAIEAGDLTLVRGDLLAAGDAIALSRRTLRIIKGNLFWAFGYNAAAIPLAAFGLLNPLIAVAAMAFSSVFVVSTSLRLRRFQPAR